MTAKERAQLVDEILQALEERGAPRGNWLLDIARVRGALADAERLLTRMQEVLLGDVEPPDRVPREWSS